MQANTTSAIKNNLKIVQLQKDTLINCSCLKKCKFLIIIKRDIKQKQTQPTLKLNVITAIKIF